MATTLVLTAKPSVGAVLIEISGAPAGAVTITRADLNGSGTVRLQEGQEPISGFLTIFDYEAALNGTITYQVLDSASTVTTDTVTTNVSNPFLNAPVLPHLRESIYAVEDYDSARENSSTVHNIVDRADPLVVSGPLRYAQGNLTLHATSFARAKAIEAIAAPGEVLLFRQPDFEGMDMYLVAKRVNIRPAERTISGRKWSVDIDYTAVKSPSGPVLSGTWNFDEIKAVGTFDAIKAQFPTFNALVAGP